MMKTLELFIFANLFTTLVKAQLAGVSGVVTVNQQPVASATILLEGTRYGTITGENGEFKILNIPTGDYVLVVSSVGSERYTKLLTLKSGEQKEFNIRLNENPAQLKEVVITGSSDASLIRNNPIAITVVSPRQIALSTGSNIIDVLVKNVPGFNAVKTGPNISKPFIRGLGYSRVLTLYDGIRQEGQQWGDEHGLEVDDYNIDKAEIIKGPSSLMYGSDALAGVISLLPHIPDKEDGKIHGLNTGEYQTNNNLIGDGLRLEYSDKHLVFALRGSYRMAKNYRNPVDGRVYLSNFMEKNFAALAGYKTGKGHTYLNFTGYDNRQGIPDGSRDSLTRRFTKQIFEGDDDDPKTRPLVSEKELTTYAIPALSQRIQHYRGYLQGAYGAGGGNVDVSLGIQQNIREESAHPTAPKLAGMNVRLRTLNYGFRYTIPEWGDIKLSVGVNGMLQNNKNGNGTDFPIPNYSLFDGGLYVLGKWKQGRWNLSGGVRYDLRNTRWGDFFVRTNPENGFVQHVLLSDTANAILQFDAFRKTFHGVSASLGATFEASSHITIKTNIGRAYRSPNITELASNGLDPGAHIIYLGNRNFDPEFSLQEDIGIAGSYKDFSFDVSLFNNNISDFIYLSLVVDGQRNPLTDAQGNKTYQYRQSAAQLYGGEILLTVHPVRISGFRIENGLSFVYGFNRNSGFKHAGTAGEYLPLIPPMKLTINMSKEFKTVSPLFVTVTPGLGTEINAAQNRFLGLNNTETATPAYRLLNAEISTEMAYDKDHFLQLVFQMNNLLNKAYQSNLSRLKYFEYYEQSPDGRSGIHNMGRNFVMKMILPF